MGTATSKDQRHRSATLKLEATSHSAKHLSQHKKKLIYGLRKAPSKPSSSFRGSMSRIFTINVAPHYPNKGTKPITGLCRISDAHDTLSGSVFAWVHAATEDLPPPGLYPTGKQAAEMQAAMCSAGCIGAICNQAAEPHTNAHMFKLV